MCGGPLIASVTRACVHVHIHTSHVSAAYKTHARSVRLSGLMVVCGGPLITSVTRAMRACTHTHRTYLLLTKRTHALSVYQGFTLELKEEQPEPLASFARHVATGMGACVKRVSVCV